MNDYDYYKSIGICPECGKRKAVPGKVHCKKCASTRSRYQKSHRESARRAWQAFNERRRENHLCRVCGKPTGGPVYCADCVEIRKVKRKIISLRKKKGAWTGRIWDEDTRTQIVIGILEKWGIL